jgi:hypothetical protein
VTHDVFVDDVHHPEPSAAPGWGERWQTIVRCATQKERAKRATSSPSVSS